MPAVVNIAAVANAHEGVVSTPGQLLASRTDDDLSQALTVPFQVSGTATPGVDYRTLLGSVEIPAGQVSAAIDIQPIDDLIPEFPEDVIVSLLASSGYDLGAASQAVVNISNQETITVTAGTNLTFTIGYTVPTTTELPVLTAEVLPIGASFSIVHSEAHAPGAHTVGEFSWTPLLEQVGSHEVVFRVTVPGTDIDEISSLTINVIPPAVGPTIDLGGSTGFEDDSQTQLFTWNVTDVNGLGPVNVSVTKDGSEIFASTDFSGSFNFDADGPGNYALTVTASNLLGESAQATRTVEVVDDDPAPPSIFLGGSFGDETENQSQFFTWDVSDDSGLSAFSVTVTRDLGNGPVEIFSTTDTAQSSGSFNFDEFRAGTYQITVNARDADGDWTGDDLSAVASQTVVVTATTSTPPVLGNNQRFGIFEGEELTLFVEGGTFLPEVPGLTASGLPAGATFALTEQTVGYAAGQFQWTPGFDQSGTYQVSFTISDSQGSDSITIFIDVLDVPPPPDTQPPSIVLGGSASEENDGQTQQFTWTASDVGGLSSVSVSVTQDGNEIFTSDQANGSYNFDSQGLGNFTIEVTATDTASLTSTASRSVTVSDDDTEPPLLVLGGSSGAENDGQPQQFTWSTSDASGLASVSVTVTQDGSEIFTSTEASGTFNFDTYGLGTFVLSATATDGDSDWTGDSLTANISSSVTVSDDDTQAPVIVLGGSSGSESESQTQEFTWEVSDDSGLSVLEIVITQDTGSGPVEIFRTEDVADAVGSFNFDSFGSGTFAIAVTAVDGDGDWNGDGSANSAMETVTVTAGNSPPALVVPETFTVSEGQRLEFDVFGFDADGNALTFSASLVPDQPLPTGATFDSSTLTYHSSEEVFSQAFSWTPDCLQAGVYNLTFTVTDGFGASATQTVSVVVANVSPAEHLDLAQAEVRDQLSRGWLRVGQSRSLLNKLEAAAASLDAGRIQRATTQLQAYLQQVAAFALPAEAAARLTADVQCVLLEPTAPSEVAIAAAQSSIAENASGPVVFTVSRTGPTATALTVSYLVSGSATGGADFSILTGTVVIPAGQVSATIEVSLLDDLLPEGTEDLTLTLTDASGILLGFERTARVEILDDDLLPTVSFLGDSLADSESAGAVEVEVFLSDAYALPVTVSFQTSDGTAVAPNDYDNTSGTVTFAPGETRQSITVNLVNDALQEDYETLLLTLSSPTNATLGANPELTLTIRDDELPTVTLTAADPEASEEGLDPGQFVVTRTGSIQQDLTVYFTIAGSATPDDDYAALPDSILIPAGTSTIVLNVEPVDDALAEGTESVELAIRNDIHYTTAGSPTATVSITESLTDILPVVSMVASVPRAAEVGLTPGAFTVTRTGSLADDLEVFYVVDPTHVGAATPGADYTTLSGSIVIPAGLASADIPVLPLRDTQREGFETVLVELVATPQYAVGAAHFAVVAIEDRQQNAAPAVKEVHPVAADFAPGKEGRVLFSTLHDDVYHTIVKTTGTNTVAQTQDGKVIITAYLDKLVAGVPVYFEVIDPDDPGRYNNQTKKFDSDQEDSNPDTLYDYAKGGDHNIEKPVSNNQPNDNRDPQKSIRNVGNALELNSFNTMQMNALRQIGGGPSTRIVQSKIVEIADPADPTKRIKVAVAEIELNTTLIYAGDNYQVQATTTNPGTQDRANPLSPLRPFRVPFGIPEEQVKSSSVLTAWWRVYYEHDFMFRAGSKLIGIAAKDDTKITVNDVSVFKVGSIVQIVDANSSRGENRRITAIDVATKTLTLEIGIRRTYKEQDNAYVGLRPANVFLITAAAAKGQNKLVVEDTSEFKKGDIVEISGIEGLETAVVDQVDAVAKTLTLESNLLHARKVDELNTPTVRNLSLDYAMLDTSKLPETFDDTFTEVVQHSQGSGPIPIEDFANDAVATAQSFSKFNDNKGKPNVFYLVGALFTPRPTTDKSRGISNETRNVSVVYFNDRSFLAAGVVVRPIKPLEIRDTTAHEIVHQFQDPADRQEQSARGHNLLSAHDGSDKCLMNAGDEVGRGVRNKTDDRYELSLDVIYQIRDRNIKGKKDI